MRTLVDKVEERLGKPDAAAEGCRALEWFSEQLSQESSRLGVSRSLVRQLRHWLAGGREAALGKGRRALAAHRDFQLLRSLLDTLSAHPSDPELLLSGFGCFLLWSTSREGQQALRQLAPRIVALLNGAEVKRCESDGATPAYYSLLLRHAPIPFPASCSSLSRYASTEYRHAAPRSRPVPTSLRPKRHTRTPFTSRITAFHTTWVLSQAAVLAARSRAAGIVERRRELGLPDEGPPRASLAGGGHPPAALPSAPPTTAAPALAPAAVDETPKISPVDVTGEGEDAELAAQMVSAMINRALAESVRAPRPPPAPVSKEEQLRVLGVHQEPPLPRGAVLGEDFEKVARSLAETVERLRRMLKLSTR